MKIPSFLLDLFSWFSPTRKVLIVEGDTPPEKLHRKHLILARDDGEDWSVAFRCPCGCNQRIELMLIKEVKPNWSISVNKRNLPTLSPSVWLKTGCKSHFWVREGKVYWC